jgi:hypothetical protein
VSRQTARRAIFPLTHPLHLGKCSN